MSHRERRANSEFYLKPQEEMAELFSDFPDAIANTFEMSPKSKDWS